MRPLRADRDRPRRRLFDLAGSDPQRRAPVNSTYAQTFSACAYALKCLIDPDLPVNDGFYRLVRLDAPAGSVANCTWPSPGRRRLGDADPPRRRHLPRAPAGAARAAPGRHEGDDVPRRLRRRRPGHERVRLLPRDVRRRLRRALASDGPDAVQTHGQNTENAPVEETELNYPVRIVQLSLVDDSDGAGPVPRRPRAAQGLPLRPPDDVHRPRPTGRTPARAGAFGGHAGKLAEYVLIRDGEETRLGAKTTVDARGRRRVSYRTCGGGGYGPPEERDPARVLRDVLEGKVSAARARDVYRVAVVGRGSTRRRRRSCGE